MVQVQFHSHLTFTHSQVAEIAISKSHERPGWYSDHLTQLGDQYLRTLLHHWFLSTETYNTPTCSVIERDPTVTSTFSRSMFNEPCLGKMTSSCWQGTLSVSKRGGCFVRQSQPGDATSHQLSGSNHARASSPTKCTSGGMTEDIMFLLCHALKHRYGSTYTWRKQ